MQRTCLDIVRNFTERCSVRGTVLSSKNESFCIQDESAALECVWFWARRESLTTVADERCTVTSASRDFLSLINEKHCCSKRLFPEVFPGATLSVEGFGIMMISASGKQFARFVVIDAHF